MESKEDDRWKLRFQNLDKAKSILDKALTAHQSDNANELFHMALIQAFEFTYELSWKCVKDYLVFQGVKKVSLPRDVIKQGFHHNILEDGQVWIDMLEDRNLMSHTYNEENAKKAVDHISGRYIRAINQLYNFLQSKLS